MSSSEIPLTGGRVTPGVVRIGDTVRRPVSGDPTALCQLLDHLSDRGFEGAPRFLGVDEQGRAILTFLPGDVPSELAYFSDAQIAAAARLLRRFHDATVDFPSARSERAEVMCHNDWGPTNTVFERGVPYAIIDFDTVAPGTRLSDLGYSAWLWLDIGNPDHDADEQSRRLTAFGGAYGLPDGLPVELAEHMAARQIALAEDAAAKGHSEMAAWANASAAWTISNLLKR